MVKFAFCASGAMNKLPRRLWFGQRCVMLSLYGVKISILVIVTGRPRRRLGCRSPELVREFLKKVLNHSPTTGWITGETRPAGLICKYSYSYFPPDAVSKQFVARTGTFPSHRQDFLVDTRSQVP